MEANKVKEYNEKSISNIAMDSIGQMGNILNKLNILLFSLQFTIINFPKYFYALLL